MSCVVYDEVCEKKMNTVQHASDACVIEVTTIVM